ncbi:MAG: motility associated factor glycosyltransferase family protein, partial [Candidatus Brocadiales bacterium]|nr:motility associated factor glycosyltransferase family protein [Candidatus Brocadiales bacterium]
MSNDMDFNMDMLNLNEFIPIQRQKSLNTADSETRARYLNNIEVLAENHPELIEIIEAAEIDEERIQLAESESGLPRIIYNQDNGEKLFIHNAEDPKDCAKQGIELLGTLDNEGIIVLFGFGLGYFTEELSKLIDKGYLIVVYEASPELFKFAMHVRDLRNVFQSKHVKFILGEDAENFSVISNQHDLIINGRFWVVKHEPSVKVNPGAYEQFLTRVQEEKKISDLGIATMVNRGREFVNAFLQNVHSIIRKPGVNKLKDIFKGRPAIIISAGPSLDHNLHLLKRAKGKAVIIATGGALPTLLAADILPDMVVEIDPTVTNIEDKFKDVPVLSQVPLVCLSQYTPELIDLYPGPLFINEVSANVANVWLQSAWEPKGFVELFGGSVAHIAFATAEVIGASTIAMVGQDLSYSGNRVHTIGYTDDLDRKLADENDSIGNAVPVLDIFGEEVSTIPQFLTFKTSFESRIRERSLNVVNATERGLAINGAETMRLTDFLSEYCDDLEAIDTFAILNDLANQPNIYSIETILNEVKYIRDKYTEISRNSKIILKHIKSVKKLKVEENRDSPELNNVLNKIEKLTEKIKDPALNIIVGYHYGLELHLRKQSVVGIDDIEDKWEMLDSQLKRGEFYYKEILTALKLFNKQLDKLITSIEFEKSIDILLADDSQTLEMRYRKTGLMYRNAGIAAGAEKYLYKAIQMIGDDTALSEENSKLYFALVETYMKQFRYYDAEQIIEKLSIGLTAIRSAAAINLKGKISSIQKEIQKKVREWEGRKSSMSSLLTAAEIKYGSDKESGYFYFRVK